MCGGMCALGETLGIGVERQVGPWCKVWVTLSGWTMRNLPSGCGKADVWDCSTNGMLTHCRMFLVLIPHRLIPYDRLIGNDLLVAASRALCCPPSYSFSARL